MALIVIDMQRDFVEPGGFGDSARQRRDAGCRRSSRPSARLIAPLPRRRLAGHPHPRGPPARPVGLPAGQAAARQPDAAHRRQRPDGPHPRPRRARQRDRRRAARRSPARSSSTSRARARSTRTDARRHARRRAASPISSSPASRPRSACRRRCARPTTAAIECLLVEDATESYFPEFKAATLAMITAQGGIVGWTAPLAALEAAVSAATVA